MVIVVELCLEITVWLIGYPVTVHSSIYSTIVEFLGDRVKPAMCYINIPC